MPVFTDNIYSFDELKINEIINEKLNYIKRTCVCLYF